MRIGIDLSNIVIGGGVTHIVEVLSNVQPNRYDIEKIVVWAGRVIKDLLPVREGFKVVHEPMLDGALPIRIYWQTRVLPKLARESCDLLFVPRGGTGGNFTPFITMSQNLLPFDGKEMFRYGASWMLLRLTLLRLFQGRGFKKAGGTIFLSEHARSMVIKQTGRLNGATTVIPHGINKRFFLPPRVQKSKDSFTPDKPFKILYTSVVDVFKHQWKVAEAVSLLRQEGYFISLDLIGPAYKPSLKLLNNTLNRIDPERDFIHYYGAVPYDKIIDCYHRANAYVFASTCEAFGQVLLEAMASGLPIACSNRSPMLEILSDAGLYFNPEQPDEIADALRALIEDASLRGHMANRAYELANAYSWERCAHETFSFLTMVAGKRHFQLPSSVQKIDRKEVE